ncbi:MAG: tRNA dihydrouridine synthase DusB [Lachnospiraceae bacterium]|nr:tRNA dihydrouridine synthase DusB [Lachnospiraceae bacterium]MBP5415746.1 tRNA dihydrouridine synthase DusB [Lachnospiraceae bacterium]
MNGLQIGDVKLRNNIILAPMAGVSDLPFRLLCARYGAGMVCMEMISAKAIMYNNKNTESLLEIHPEEGCVSLQLFGSDPKIMSEQAKRIEDRPYDILDINMGCPVPKVVNNGEGSALMKDPILAGQIIEAIVKNTSKPVTVKIRKGFANDELTAPDIAYIAQESGASAVTVHGRTREQYYSGKADWNAIAEVKRRVSIPVIGNGDVTDGESAKRMFDETGCDAVAIGRAAQGNPFIFREILHFIETREKLNRPDGTEMFDTVKEHARLMIEYKGEYTAVREMRKHLSWYSAGMPGSARLRGRINEMCSMDDILSVARLLFKPCET